MAVFPEGADRRATRWVVLLCAALAALGCSADEGSESGGSRAPTPGSTGSFGNATGTGAGGSGSFGNPTNPTPTGGGGGSSEPMVIGGEGCASAMVQTSRTTPLIEFVIDGSGSMCAPFGGPTRWQALRTALLDPNDGLIYRLQSVVHFGSVLYDGSIDVLLAATGLGSTPSPACAGAYIQQKAMTECPLLVDVPPAPNNAMAIDMGFPATELGGSTPTDRALTWTVDRLIEQQATGPDQESLPQYIILATDGAPNDICYGGTALTPEMVAQNVLAQVDRAAAAGITIFVISLAGNDPALQAHLDEVARRGDPNNPMATTYNPTTPEDLTNTLAALVGGAVGCEIFLNGSVTPGRECSGFVESLGNRLPCCVESASGWTCNGQPVAQPDGWRLKDEKTVELIGPTCTDFLSNPDVMLRADFPCDVFVPD